MNWSRAKTILIAILVLVNAFLLFNYLRTEWKSQQQISESTKSAALYLEERGVSISCDIPEKSEKLPVILVNFSKGDVGGGIYDIDIDGTIMEIIGLKDSAFIKNIEITDKKIETLPAYTALLKSYGSIEGEITNIQLIYLVDRSAYVGQEGEDTALPYWKISSGENSYYYSAFAE